MTSRIAIGIQLHFILEYVLNVEDKEIFPNIIISLKT